MKVLAFINEKGGTCKTTFSVNFAAYFALKRHKKVLLIDFDSQGHAGKSLGLHVHEADKSIFDLLINLKLSPKQAILQTSIKKLDIIVANKDLAEFPIVVANDKDRELKLYKVIKKIEKLDYDYVFIDAPPSVGLLTRNILVASTDIVVPVALTYLSLDGCAEVVGSIKSIREKHKQARPVLGMVIPTLYRKTRLANAIVAKLAEYFPDKITKTILGFNVKIDEAQSFGQTIWEYDAKGRGAKMMRALAIELYNKVLKV